MILLQIIFSAEKFNILPQLYTWSGRYPDIVLETFFDRPGSTRKLGFVFSDFIEAKSAESKDDPIKQLTLAISEEHGAMRHSKGLLIGVVGLTWRFVEYHWVSVPGSDMPRLLLEDFHTPSPGSPKGLRRPQRSREYKEGCYMDLTIEEEARDILNILIWRSGDGETRDLSYKRHHAEAIPKSLTRSTLSMGDLTEEDIPDFEKLVLASAEFGYLVPFLTARDVEMAERGGNQEGDRMEVD